MRRLGIDIGSLYLGAVVLDEGSIREVSYREHRGDVRAALGLVLDDPRFQTFDTVGITGARHPGTEGTLDDVLAAIEGIRFLLPDCRNAFLVGGQTFALVLFDEQGRYREHSLNPPCAAGTGSFIEQQAERLDLSVEELSSRALAFTARPAPIATRCAVFAKTDMIHAMQEGHSLDAICAGLCDGIARNVVDALVKGRALTEPVGLVGGVAQNRRLVQAMERRLGRRITVPGYAQVAGAVGAALLGREKLLDRAAVLGARGLSVARRPRLPGTLSGYPDLSGFDVGVTDGVEIFSDRSAPEPGQRLTLGIDIGSTSTKAVVLDERDVIAGGFYTATQGDPVTAVRRLLTVLRATLPAAVERLRVVGTTGSGRKMIKELFAADLEVDEITAQARAAVHLDPRVDTVVEIGGQDSKLARLRDGDVYFSAMNYVCAAGTGSFIEEQARRLGVSLSELAEMALAGEAPFTSDRCTVYMERDLSALLSEGWSRESLAAAVVHSVRDNYLAKVVGRSPLGQHVVFQGATARNRALVASFEAALGRPVYVSPYCHLTGALGAALLAREAMTSTDPGRSFQWDLGAASLERESCRICANHCALTLVRRDTGVAAWGMKCGRDPSSPKTRETRKSAPETRMEAAMAPLLESLPVPRRERDVTVGIPLALAHRELAPLWQRFLGALGFRVKTSRMSREVLGLGRAAVTSDFCAPMVAAHGAIAQLLRAGADFVFCPAVVSDVGVPGACNEPLSRKTTDSFYCYYSQYLPTIAQHSIALSVGSRLVSPALSLGTDSRDATVDSLLAGLRAIDPELSREEVERAWDEASGLFHEARWRWSQAYTEAGDGHDRVRVVVAGRPYVAFDPSVSLDVPAKLEALGAEVFWQDEIDLDERGPWPLTERYLERMHWYYGRTIVRLAELCARSDNLFMVFLSGFRCSPDSFLMSYVKDVLTRAGKPFLVLQLDEHASDVGYVTRMEAALRSFDLHRRGARDRTPRPPELPSAPASRDLVPGDTVLVPYLDEVVSPLFRASFRAAGFEAHLLDSTEQALATGYRFASGGECMPLVWIAGGAIDVIRREHLDPARTYLYLSYLCLACNLPQFPVFARAALDGAGLGATKVGEANWIAQGTALPALLGMRMLEASLVGGLLWKVFHAIKPYERTPGETDAVFAEAQRALQATFEARGNGRTTLAEAAERFRQIPLVQPRVQKPRLALVGDIYVKANDTVNQDLRRVVLELGGELVVSSLNEYPLHILAHDRNLPGGKDRGLGALKRMESRYAEVVKDLLPGIPESDPDECAALLREYGIAHQFPGEATITIGRVLYLLKRGLVDAVLHVNPMFCCPGVVSAAVFRKVQRDFGVPVIDLFYDAAGRPNRTLAPYLHYLAERKRAAGPSRSANDADGEVVPRDG